MYAVDVEYIPLPEDQHLYRDISQSAAVDEDNQRKRKPLSFMFRTHQKEQR